MRQKRKPIAPPSEPATADRPSKKRRLGGRPPALGIIDGTVKSMMRFENRPDPKYMRRHPSLNVKMRAILFHWLTEVGQEFLLKRRTMYSAFQNVDLFLTRHEGKFPKSQLQLLGITALFISCKAEETQPPCVSDMAMTTAEAYTSEEILEMERVILEQLGWKLHSPTSLTYLSLLHHLIHKRASPAELEKLLLGRGEDSIQDLERSLLEFHKGPHYVTEFMALTGLLDILALHPTTLCFRPSEVAASLMMLHAGEDREYFTAVVTCVTGFSLEELTPCMKWMAGVLAGAPTNPDALKVVKEMADRQKQLIIVELFTVQSHNGPALAFLDLRDAFKPPSKMAKHSVLSSAGGGLVDAMTPNPASSIDEVIRKSEHTLRPTVLYHKDISSGKVVFANSPPKAREGEGEVTAQDAELICAEMFPDLF